MRMTFTTRRLGCSKTLYVDESQRGGGLATRLVQEVIAAAAGGGVLQTHRHKPDITSEGP